MIPERERQVFELNTVATVLEFFYCSSFTEPNRDRYLVTYFELFFHGLMTSAFSLNLRRRMKLQYFLRQPFLGYLAVVWIYFNPNPSPV